MSNILPAPKTVELVDELKQTVEEFVVRADKLNEEFRLQTAREQRRHEVAAEQQKSEAIAAQLEANAALEAAQKAARFAFEHRKTWIGKAYQSSKELGLKRVDDRIGGRKYELQRRMLQAERDRESGLARVSAASQQFRNHLAAEQEALAEVERAAQRSFKGYPGFQRVFQRAYESAEPVKSTDHERLLGELRDLIGKGAGELGRFKGVFLVRLFRFLGAWILLACAALALAPLAKQFGWGGIGWPHAIGLALGLLALSVLLRFFAIRSARPLVDSVSQTLARARHVHTACHEHSETHFQQELERVNSQFAETTQNVDRELKQTLAKAGEMRVGCRMKADERAVRANKSNERTSRARFERVEKAHAEAQTNLKQAGELRARELAERWEQQRRQIEATRGARFQELEKEWKVRIGPIYSTLQSSAAETEVLFPAWDSPHWTAWKPAREFHHVAAYGRLHVNVPTLCAGNWADRGLQLPGSPELNPPLCVVYPENGSLLFETHTTEGHDQAIGALNNLILRLLSTAPPGRLNFTILDPIGLGQNFAGVMHLADFEEQLINSRIWTQSLQFEQKLGELNEHMEKVIQMYLRNEYQTIAEYNEQAGVIAEKYHFLVVADFPANFSDVAAKRLMSIAASGARCGVYMLMHWDHRHALPQDFMADDLRKSCFSLTAKANHFAVTGKEIPGTRLVLDAPPAPEIATNFIQQVGQASRDSSRVEVPFEHVAPADSEIWTADTVEQLRVAIGRTGATKLQYLEIGRGTCQHGLVAGKTGSGKSTLFHVIITNLSLWCSPEQVEFYLVDFKKGVEFKCYAARGLPHARVVAIESDREFALSVLQRVDDELRRRGDLFRQLGVQDLAGYKRAGGTEPIPRTLLLIDEFQEYFVEDDKIAQTASLLLDRIVRQGRAFGIHVLLGSQTLGGAYTVARTTLGQMVIRIALQCNEADAYLIMDDTNPAPRLLSRPGEGIYNDMAGALEGNSPFQVVWLPEEVRDAQLSKVTAHAKAAGRYYPGPVIFEGNAPADVHQNALLNDLLDAPPRSPLQASRIWLGAPNSIKGPTEVRFNRQSGSNLLIVGQREEAILAMLSIGLVTLAAQNAPDRARIFLLDTTPQGTTQRVLLEQVVKGLPTPVQMPRPAELADLMNELRSVMKQRSESPDPESAPPVFLLIHDLQKFARLRFEEDFGFTGGSDTAPAPSSILNEIICEGTRLGLHVMATCDTYNNVTRFLSRKAISEFEMRVLFQMSANDSASLIDNPKAGMLGLHRALYYSAQEGYLETFRPYALPGTEWFERASQKLSVLAH